MYKAVKNLQKQEGFTLIELLIVVAITSILAAVGITAYIGMTKRAKKSTVIRTAEAHLPEFQALMNSAKKAGTILGGLTEIDTDGDGLIVEGVDKSNDRLGNSDIIQIFIDKHNPIDGLLPLTSPWDNLKPLFVYAKHQPDLSACEAAAVTYSGQIIICYNGTNAGADIRYIFVVAVDIKGNVIYKKPITAD